MAGFEPPGLELTPQGWIRGVLYVKTRVNELPGQDLSLAPFKGHPQGWIRGVLYVKTRVNKLPGQDLSHLSRVIRLGLGVLTLSGWRLITASLDTPAMFAPAGVPAQGQIDRPLRGRAIWTPGVVCGLKALSRLSP